MSKHYLLTFLGGADTEYDPVDYQFEGGVVLEDCRFLSAGLPQYFEQAGENPVTQVLVFGTNSSNWDILYRELTPPTGADTTSDMYALSAFVKNNAIVMEAEEQPLVTDNEISDHWDLLQKFLKAQHPEWSPQLIPYGSNKEEQIALLRHIFSISFNEGDRVTIDITHGLRHLPMLVVMVALYLEKVRKVKIHALFYGADELWYKNDDQTAQVMDLKGLLDIAHWIGALNAFDQDGDYAVFELLLAKDNFSESTTLKEAAFAEQVLRINGPDGAANLLGIVREQLEQDLGGISGLFTQPLLERTQWAESDTASSKDEPWKLYRQQHELACRHLADRNYLQAVIFAVEAFITKLFDQDAKDYDD